MKKVAIVFILAIGAVLCIGAEANIDLTSVQDAVLGVIRDSALIRHNQTVQENAKQLEEFSKLPPRNDLL